MEKAYKFRAYPAKEQQYIINGQMFLAKQLYNMLLEKSRENFRDTGKTFTRYDMNKWITQLKRRRPEFKEIYSQVLQNVADRTAKAYQNFFYRLNARKKGKKIKVGFPRFKSFVPSLTYPQQGFKIERKRVHLSKIGRVNFVNHREIVGKVKTLAIKNTRSGEWYITLSVEQEAKPSISNNKPKVGLDLGLMEYATLSDGTKITNMRFGRKLSNKTKRAQREISKREKGGKNRNKSRIKVARILEHATRQREDYLHKVSNTFVNSYSFIGHENLQIANMAKNHRFARNINDASWAKFIQFLHYKAENAGCEIVGVDPKNTTKTCSECGNVQRISLNERLYEC